MSESMLIDALQSKGVSKARDSRRGRGKGGSETRFEG